MPGTGESSLRSHAVCLWIPSKDEGHGLLSSRLRRRQLMRSVQCWAHKECHFWKDWNSVHESFLKGRHGRGRHLAQVRTLVFGWLSSCRCDNAGLPLMDPWYNVSSIKCSSFQEYRNSHNPGSKTSSTLGVATLLRYHKFYIFCLFWLPLGRLHVCSLRDNIGAGYPKSNPELWQKRSVIHAYYFPFPIE